MIDASVSQPTPTALPTLRCAYCKAVLYEGPQEAGISDGIGPCCWDLARAKAGLAPKPFPGRA